MARPASAGGHLPCAQRALFHRDPGSMKPISVRDGDSLSMGFTDPEEFTDPDDVIAARFFSALWGAIDSAKQQPTLVAQAAEVVRVFPVGALVHAQQESFWNKEGEVGAVVHRIDFPPGGIGVLFETGRLGQFSASELLAAGLLPLTGPSAPHPQVQNYDFRSFTQLNNDFADGSFENAFDAARRTVARMKPSQ